MNPSHGLSWEKSGEQEGVFATLFILTGKLASKLAYVDFQLINVTGYTDIPMPTGFTYNNCISISLLVLYNGNIYFEDDISSFYVTIQNGKYQVYNSNNIFYGCTVGVAFMRTDI